MQRKLTAEERQILLDNPELVMFNPKRISYGMAWVRLIAPTFIIGILAIFLPLIFPEVSFFRTDLYVGIGITVSFLSIPVIIIFNFVDSGEPGKRQQKTHYLRELKKSLPKELMLNIVTIRYVVPHDGVVCFFIDGKEDSYGLPELVNPFKLDPGARVVTVFEKDFHAFIKRAPQTEVLYESLLQEAGGEG